MEINTNILLFETRLTKFDKFLVLVYLVAGTIGLIFSVVHLLFKQWGICLFICTVLILQMIQAIRVAKTFHLYSDRLVVKRPFFFSDKTDHVFKVSQLKEVRFRDIKGRFGGPHLIVRSVGLHESYRIDMKEEDVSRFITSLTYLGIKTGRDNM